MEGGFFVGRRGFFGVRTGGFFVGRWGPGLADRFFYKETIIEGVEEIL
jgi:hypothetical protein